MYHETLDLGSTGKLGIMKHYILATLEDQVCIMKHYILARLPGQIETKYYVILIQINVW